MYQRYNNYKHINTSHVPLIRPSDLNRVMRGVRLGKTATRINFTPSEYAPLIFIRNGDKCAVLLTPLAEDLDTLGPVPALHHTPCASIMCAQGSCVFSLVKSVPESVGETQWPVTHAFHDPAPLAYLTTSINQWRIFKAGWKTHATLAIADACFPHLTPSHYARGNTTPFTRGIGSALPIVTINFANKPVEEDDEEESDDSHDESEDDASVGSGASDAPAVDEGVESMGESQDSGGDEDDVEDEEDEDEDAEM